MARYKLIGGVHEEDGVRYKAGEIVESLHDLTQVKGKFVLADVVEYKPEGPGPGARLYSDRPMPQQPPAPQPAPQTPAAPAQVPDEDETSPSVAPSPATDTASTAPVGTDVTERFQMAKEQDFKVYKRTVYTAPDTGPFFVYDNDDTSKVIGGHGVKRAEVEEVIKQAIKTE